MPKKLVAAVLAAIVLDLLAAGYGAIAAGREDHVLCSQEHGSVTNHECVKNGQVLFGVPL